MSTTSSSSRCCSWRRVPEVRRVPGRSGRDSTPRILVLVTASLAAALGLTFLPDAWARWPGLIPLAFGLHGLIAAARGSGADEAGEDAEEDAGREDAARRGALERGAVEREVSPSIASGAASAAGVTIANGGDNIAVYTPVFRTIGHPSAALTVAVFAVGVAVWCLAASWLGSHPKIIGLVERYGRWIVPGVFVLIGVLILAESPSW